jgi:hypothetical protein
LNSGQQQILLGPLGSAVGGSFNMTTDLGSLLGSLVIPHGVLGYANFTTSHQLSFSGDVTNYGKIIEYSKSPGPGAGLLSAADIVNGRNAVITSVLGSRLSTSLGALATPFDMTLSANSLTNRGFITSSGALNLIANNISNYGVFNTKSSINISPQVGSGLVNVDGGKFISQQLNFNAGQAAVLADIGSSTGLINVCAQSAQIGSSFSQPAANSTLKFGSINLAGDPTFYNFNGNVVLSGNINVGQHPLAIISSHNVFHSGGNISTDGMPILIIAGASIESTFSIVNSGQQNNQLDAHITLYGGSRSGGRIDLTGTPVLSSGAPVGTTAGEIQLIAYAGSDPLSGTVTMPGLIQSSGNTCISPLIISVLVDAGARSGNAITIGAIQARPGNSVVLASQTPDMWTNVLQTQPALSGFGDAIVEWPAFRVPAWWLTQSGNINVGSVSPNGQWLQIYTNGTSNLSANIPGLTTSSGSNSSAESTLPPFLFFLLNGFAGSSFSGSPFVEGLSGGGNLIQVPILSSTILPTDATRCRTGIDMDLVKHEQPQLFTVVSETSAEPAIYVSENGPRDANVDCLQESDGSVKLNRGAIFVCLGDDKTIDINHAAIHLAAGSAILIEQSDVGASVCDLADGSSGDVMVDYAGKSITLEPGQEFVVTDKSGKFDEINPLAHLGYRHVVAEPKNNGISAYLCEFPVINAMRFARLEHHAHSGDARCASLLSKLLKSAASVQVATITHGPYRTKHD